MSYEHDEQGAFRDLLEEMDATAAADLAAHRTDVQRWHDTLPEVHKAQLGEWLHRREWVTFQALSAASGDWYASIGRQ
jgi:hypothetical protein